MIDKGNVQAYAKALSHKTGQYWSWVPGYYWYQEVVPKAPDDKFDLKPYGQVIVLFLNRDTGEIKSVLGSLFKKD